MPEARIIGTGSSVPERVLSNKELESIVDTTDEWITRRTGIKERRISIKDENESTSDLATRASLRAMEMAGVSSQAIDMIVVATVSSDRRFPSTACMVQKELDTKNAAAFDVSAACSGFLYALTTAYNAIQTGTSETALVIGAERLSSIVNWEDRNTCVLMADGAGAILLSSQKGDGRGIMFAHLKSDGSLWNLLYTARGNSHIPETLQGMDLTSSYMIMNGNRLFKKAIESMSSAAKEVLNKTSLTGKEIALVVPHQANIRIIQALAKDLNIPMEKVYTNIHKYGNTSSASIPIALDEANRDGRINKGDYVLMVAFGGGLTWGASILEWSI